MKTGICTILMLLVLFPAAANAQEAVQGLKAIWSAEVESVLDEREEVIAGTKTETIVQELRVRLTEGERAGELVSFENNTTPLAEGDKIYVTYVQDINGAEYFYLYDIQRQTPMVVLALLFVGLLVWFAGRQGVRAVLSLAVSIAAIVGVLVPLMLAGYDPVLVSLGIAGVILALVLFGTHGFTPVSYIAFGGTFSAVLITSVVAWVFVGTMQLTGFSSDASVALNFATDGNLDFAGLLLGSIIIGILGVLDDVSITQASVVGELKHANPALAAKSLYARAIKVGRDHVGSLVNTLALAYVGAALPLVLWYSTSEYSWYLSVNQEIIAAEIARILIGSIGLVAAVPLTTLLAAWWFGSHGVDEELAHSLHHH